MAQIIKALRGGMEREESQVKREANWVANLMNATGNFSKKAVTANALLGLPDKPRGKRKPNAAEREAIKARAERRRLKMLRERGTT